MTDLQPHRRLSAIVMADVVGYSLMMNEDEIAKIEQKLRRTKQSNKKQEINSVLKKAKSDLEILKKNL